MLSDANYTVTLPQTKRKTNCGKSRKSKSKTGERKSMKRKRESNVKRHATFRENNPDKVEEERKSKKQKRSDEKQAQREEGDKATQEVKANWPSLMPEDRSKAALANFLRSTTFPAVQLKPCAVCGQDVFAGKCQDLPWLTEQEIKEKPEKERNGLEKERQVCFLQFLFSLSYFSFLISRLAILQVATDPDQP
jgi:hypothetical protein